MGHASEPKKEGAAETAVDAGDHETKSKKALELAAQVATAKETDPKTGKYLTAAMSLQAGTRQDEGAAPIGTVTDSLALHPLQA